MSLREELGARPDPAFRLMLPPGWSRFAPDDESRERLLLRARQRMMEAGRPDLYVAARRMLQEAFGQMREARVTDVFAAAEASDDALTIPASIVVTRLQAEPGQTLDRRIASLRQKYGAQPLDERKRIVYYERESPRPTDAGTIIVHERVYITPVPGSRRRRALRLTASFGSLESTPADARALVAMRELFDACVGSLSWAPPTTFEEAS